MKKKKLKQLNLDEALQSQGIPVKRLNFNKLQIFVEDFEGEQESVLPKHSWHVELEQRKITYCFLGTLSWPRFVAILTGGFGIIYFLTNIELFSILQEILTSLN